MKKNIVAIILLLGIMTILNSVNYNTWVGIGNNVERYYDREFNVVVYRGYSGEMAAVKLGDK